MICRSCNEDHARTGGCNNNAWEAGLVQCPACGNAPVYALTPETIDDTLEATPCAECAHLLTIEEGMGITGPYSTLVWAQ